MNKKWYLSKTLWVNAIAIVASFFSADVLDTQTQLQILGVINLILRLITKSPVEW
jgi:hypothetical protein